MEIQSKSIWKDGVNKNATQLLLHTEFDDMATNAKFAYRLFTSDGEQLVSGYLQIDGIDYQEWSGSNKDAYIWAAKELNLKPIA